MKQTERSNCWASIFAKQAKLAEIDNVTTMYTMLDYLDELGDTEGPKSVIKEIKDMMKDIEIMYPNNFGREQ